MQLLEALTALSRKLGPYVLIEVLLPGGTLVAFTLFAVRHPAIPTGLLRQCGRFSRRSAPSRASLASRS